MQTGSGFGHDAVRTAYDPVEARGRFIARTYNHLFGAIVAFAAILGVKQVVTYSITAAGRLRMRSATV